MIGKREGRRQVRNGEPTNDLVVSAYIESNADVFPHILNLYVPTGRTVADVTFGKGVFWKNVPVDSYDLLATDIKDGVDCRELPYQDASIDCVVLDPPYMHSPGGTAHSSQPAFEEHYRNNGTGNNTEKKYHDAVLDLYEKAGEEAFRVLRERGVFIVKCQRLPTNTTVATNSIIRILTGQLTPPRAFFAAVTVGTALGAELGVCSKRGAALTALFSHPAPLRACAPSTAPRRSPRRCGTAAPPASPHYRSAAPTGRPGPGRGA